MAEEKKMDVPENPESVQPNDAAVNVEAGEPQTSDEQVQPETGASQAEYTQGGHTGRKIAVSLLVILGLLLLFVANYAFWASSTLLNTNRWVNAVGSLTQDQEIAEVIGVFIAGEISEVTDIDEAVTEILPEKFEMLSNPLSKALIGLVEDAVAVFVQSDVVNAVWVTTNRVAHTLVLGVLEGKGDKVYFETGQLVIDISPLIETIEDTFGLERLDLDLVGEDGKIVLLENEKVAVLQQIVAVLNAVGLLLPLISLVVLVIAVWVSLWRRKTMMWIGIGIAIVMLLSILVYNLAESWMLASIADPLLRFFTGEILDVVTHGLLVQSIVLMILGVLIILGAWVVGPSRAAVDIRTEVSGWRN
ncbi:hypothetical protein ACFLUC_00080 [Chloroflexota bacterium]